MLREPKAGGARAVAGIFLAEAYYKRGRFVQAHEVLESAKQISSSSYITYLQALTYMKQGDYRSMHDMTRALLAVSRRPNYLTIAILAAMLCDEQEQVEKLVEELLERSRWRGPRLASKEALRLEGFDGYAAAKLIYDAVLQRWPRYVPALRGLVRVGFKTDDFCFALTSARRLYAVRPDAETGRFIEWLEMKCQND